LTKDMTLKARIYAECAVTDYWVVDIPNRCWRIHRQPADNGYASIEALEWAAVPRCNLLPGLMLTLPKLPG
jgi:Uma2 family endonuclease